MLNPLKKERVYSAETNTKQIKVIPNLLDAKDGEKNIKDDAAVAIVSFTLKGEDGLGKVTIAENADDGRKCKKRFLGMGLTIVASMCFSMSVTLVKVLRDYNYDMFSIGVWRFGGGCLLPSILILIYYQFVKKSHPFETIYPLCQKDKCKTFSILLVRAATGTGSILLQYSALKYISISDTTVVAFSSPVFIIFFACLLLGETFGLVNILAALLTTVGVAIITRPPFLTGASEMDTNTMTGVGLALGAMTLGVFIFLSLRMLKAVNFAVVNLYFGIVGTLFCYIMSECLSSFEIPRSPWDWFLACLIAALTLAGLVLQTVAFKYEDAGPLSLCRSFDVIYSFVWQGIFLSVLPDNYSIVGSLVVLAGVLLVGFRKHLSSLPKDHPCRKTFFFILK